MVISRLATYRRTCLLADPSRKTPFAADLRLITAALEVITGLGTRPTNAGHLRNHRAQRHGPGAVEMLLPMMSLAEDPVCEMP